MIILGVLFIAAAIALLTKDRIENYIAFSIIIITLETYVFAVAGIIEAGFWVAVLLAICSLIYVIIRLIRDKLNIIGHVFTPALLAFCVFAFLIVLLNVETQAARSPDSPFWVVIAKGVHYYNDFGKGLFAKTHPQYIAIWGYSCMKSFGKWSDSFLVISNNIYKVSILLPLFSCLSVREKVENKSKGLLNNAILSVIVFLIPYISAAGEYKIYAPDMLMALLLGMGMVMFTRAITEEKDSFYLVAIAYFCAAVLTKRIGIAILAILLVWCIYVLLDENRKALIAAFVICPILTYALFKRVNTYSVMVIGALFAAIVLKMIIEKKSWMLNAVLAIIAGVVGVFGGIILARKIADKYPSVDHLVVAKSFFKMLISVDDKYYYVGNMVKLPVVLFLICVVAVFVLLERRKEIHITKAERIIFIGIIVSMLIYIALLFYLYMTQISAATGKLFEDSLLGLDRYMKIIPIIILCFVVSIVVGRYGKSSRVMGILLMTVLVISNLNILSKDYLIKEDNISFPELRAGNIELKEGTNLGYIDMDEISHFRFFQIDILPCTMTNVDELSTTYRKANNMEYISVDELSKELEDCDYVYIYSADDQFQKLYNELFYDKEKIKVDRAVYSVDKDTGLLMLLN